VSSSEANRNQPRVRFNGGNSTTDLVTVSPAGMEVAGEVPPAPSSAKERLALWCSRLPSLAPEGCVR
jgi:hypothetical protein